MSALEYSLSESKVKFRTRTDLMSWSRFKAWFCASSPACCAANFLAIRIRKPSRVMSTESVALSCRWRRLGISSSGSTANPGLDSARVAAARAAAEALNFTGGLLILRSCHLYEAGAHQGAGVAWSANAERLKRRGQFAGSERIGL